jgi:hypothetical protein
MKNKSGENLNVFTPVLALPALLSRIAQRKAIEVLFRIESSPWKR